MRSLVRSAQMRIFVIAGVAAGGSAWVLGPQAALALLVGLGVVGGLALAEWLRMRQRWIVTEITKLRASGAAELQAAERRIGARMSEHWNRERGELTAARAQVTTLGRRITADRRQQLAQIQAVQNLYAILPIRHRMPAAGPGWSVSPDYLLLVVSLLQQHRPATIVELGSGVSTVWTAAALHEFGIEARMVSIDHDARYASVTQDALATAALEKVVEIRHVPLVDLRVGGQMFRWYDPAALADVDSCDLALVDGPPGELQPRSRYPALPVLADRMRPGAQLLLDDYLRADEQQIVSDWLVQHPGWTVQELALEKGAALLTRTS